MAEFAWVENFAKEDTFWWKQKTGDPATLPSFYELDNSFAATIKKVSNIDFIPSLNVLLFVQFMEQGYLSLQVSITKEQIKTTLNLTGFPKTPKDNSSPADPTPLKRKRDQLDEALLNTSKHIRAETGAPLPSPVKVSRDNLHALKTKMRFRLSHKMEEMEHSLYNVNIAKLLLTILGHTEEIPFQYQAQKKRENRSLHSSRISVQNYRTLISANRRRRLLNFRSMAEKDGLFRMVQSKSYDALAVLTISFKLFF